MKILCLLVILANIIVFLWEYRSGAFVQQMEVSGQTVTNGKEQIYLVSETKGKPEPAKPIRAPETQLDKPTNNSNFNQSEKVSNNPTEVPHNHLP